MIPEPLCIADENGSLVKVNSAFSTLSRYSEEELIKIRVLDLVHQEDREVTTSVLHEARNGKPLSGLQNRLLCKNGRIAWLEWTISPSSDIDGHIYASAKDITRRVLTEDWLREAIDDLKTAQKIARLGYWSRDLKTEMNRWTEQVYKIYEKDPETFEPSQKAVEELFHPDDRYLVKKAPDKQFRESDDMMFEHRIITDSGRLKWLMERSHLVRNEDGEPVMMKGTVQDITEIKEKERELEISNERFELAIQASNELIWDWDLKTDQVTRSAGYNEMFGFSLLKTNGEDRPWFKNIHPNDREGVKESLTRFLRDRDRNLNVHEYRIVRADGEILYVMDRAFLIRDESGNPLRIVGAVLDVTESRKMIHEIQRQNAELKEIAWMQSHGVRAPLSRILSIAELLKNGNVTEEEYEQLFESVVKSAGELDDMVRTVAAKTEALNRSSNGL